MAATTTPIAATNSPTSNPAGRGPNGPGITPIIPGQTGAGPVPTYTLAGAGPGSVPSAGTLNGVATTAQVRQQQVVAENAVLRLVYGRTTIGAQIADVLFSSGNLVIFVVWGRGPWNAIETVYLDDKAPPSGVTITNYLGGQVAADATLVAAYAAQSPSIAYNDILPGVAYSVIVLPPHVTTGFPRISATVQGLKVHEPRYAPKLKWLGAKSIVPEVGPNPTSMTRALAAYFSDWEGLLKLAPANCARFTGARFVQNLCTQHTEGNPTTKTASGTSPPTVTALATYLGQTCISVAFPSGVASRADSSAQLNAFPVTAGHLPRQRCRVALSRALTGSEAIRIRLDGVWGFPQGDITFNSAFSPTTFVEAAGAIPTLGTGTGTDNFLVEPSGTALGSGVTVYITDQQLEDVTGQSNQNPSEYVSVGVLAFPFQGAGADGCQFFDTQNGNTVVANVVTAGVGAAIPAATLKRYRKEKAATNQFLNSTVPATHTSGALPVGQYVLWITGSGSVAVAAATATITGAGSATAAAPLVFNVTVTGTVTFTVAAPVTFAQCEAGSIQTSRIDTAGAAVTRPEDKLIWPISVFSDTAGTAYAEYQADDWPSSNNSRVIGGASTGYDPIAVVNGNYGGIQSWDGTTQALGPAGAWTGLIVKGASVWGGGTKQVFSSGAGGVAGAYGGSFNMTSVGIGVNGSSGFQGNIGAVEIYDRKFSPTAVLQFPTTANYAILDSANDPQLIYSDNPALAIGDLQTNATYGASDLVDWTSVAKVANDNEALVGGTEKRRILGLCLDTVQPLPAWFDALRAYAGCFLARTAGKLVLISDRPASSTFTFSEATGNARISKLRRRSKRDAPTVSAIRYTDTTVFPWRDNIAYAYAPGALAGTVPWKIHEVAMPGITRFSHATREATEQLNKLRLTDLTLDIAGQDESLAVTVGDVVTVSANVGLSSRLVRVLNINTAILGRPIFSVEGYDPTVYSDSVAAGPGIVDTSLPDQTALSPPTALVITETPYLEQVNGSALAGGLIYQSRFDCTWTAPALAFPVNYRVEIYDGATKIRDEFVSSTAYSTPTLQQGKTYTVNVYTRNTLTESVALTGSKLVAGNTVAPNPVPSITSGRELGGDVLLEWLPSVSVDVVRYEWRYFPNGTGSWATATLIDRVDAVRARFKGLPVGTHRFYVRAINSVGLYSATDVNVDVTVTTDANAFVQSRLFTSPTLTNMAAIYSIEDGTNTPRWATSVAGQTWDASITGTVNAVATPVIVQHLAGTQKWQGESWDLGTTITGDWTFTPNTSDISGAATYALETSPDGSTWTAQPGVSWKGSTRFIRPAINNLTSGTMIVTAPPKIAVAALSKTESAKVTTLASGGLLVALTGKYSGAQDLQATAINTSLARIVTADRILMHPQAGLMQSWTATAGGAAYSTLINTSGRVIAAGDYVEYDVYIDPSSPAAATSAEGDLVIHFTDATYTLASNAQALVDQNGYDYWTPAIGMDALARGMWYSRKAQLVAGCVGKTVDQVIVGSSGVNNTGARKVLFRNIRFTNGAGTDRAAIWPPTLGGSIQAEPASNTNYISTNASNGQLGPANTFLLYAFTDAGAQVAQDCQYSFRGY